MFWLVYLPVSVFVLIILLGIVVAIKERDGETFGAALGIAFLSGLLLLAVGGIIGLIISPDVRPVAVLDKDHPTYLVSIANDQYTSGSIHGSIFLISGSFSETEKFRYRYYLNGGNSGAIASGEVVSTRALIFEDTENKPYLLRYKVVCPEDRKRSIFLYDSCQDYLGISPQYEVQFHIPKGSVIQDLTITP